MTMTRRLALAAVAASTIARPAMAQKSAAQQDWENQQAEWLAANLKAPGWKATASGLQFKKVKANPKGGQPKADSLVAIKYEGQTISDVVFDASPEGQPFEVKVGELVKGMAEALPMMRTGEVWEFAMPASLGYGDRAGRGRPAGSALRFRVELVKILG